MIRERNRGITVRIIIAGAIGAALTLACGPAAHAGTFSSQQILVLGSAAVSAQAINDRGTIVGAYQPTSTQQAGFILQGGAIYVLGGSVPAAVNRSGEVAGYGNNGGFVWQNGSFLPGVSFSVSSVDGALPEVLLNNHGVIAYVEASQGAQYVYAGTPQKPHVQKGLSTSHTVVTSINSHGVMAGFEVASVSGQPVPAVFVGKAGLYDVLVPNFSGFGNSANAFVNDAGQVAFSDGQALYLFSNGAYTQVAMPASQVFGVQVMGYNNSGRAVGIYTNSSQTPALQTVFYYNGHTVSTFGTYAAGDIVHVALNDFGVMVVSDTPAGTASLGTSYRVTCRGTAC